MKAIGIKTTKGVQIHGILSDTDNKSEHIRSYKEAEEKNNDRMKGKFLLHNDKKIEMQTRKTTHPT
jgi:hypothetical protein